MQPIILLRDNIYRALAEHDPDYTRNLEGPTIRLHWDEGSLLQLVSARLRVALGLGDQLPAVKVWDRVAHRGLRGKSGFKRCLRLTLYRPRDILILLNQAFLSAHRDGRREIVDEDVESAAKRVSQNRLQDLRKEYTVVFPGIENITSAFENGKAEYPVPDVLRLVEDVRAQGVLDPRGAQHATILGGPQIIQSLYGIGFLGLLDPTLQQYKFCHDGSAPDELVDSQDRRVLIHPCYWLALNCSESPIRPADSAQIYDEHDIGVVSEQVELRRQCVGRLLAELGKIPQGQEGATAFEAWCKEALEVVCAGQLTHFAHHPNADAIQRRDLVAANVADSGFWERFRDNFGATQVVFETKNYDDLEPDDFRQMASYLHGRYGTAGFMITRGTDENPSRTALGWVKEFYHEKKVLLIILSEKIMRRIVSKCRDPARYSYSEEQLQKLLNLYQRNYLSLRHQAPEKKRRR